MGLWWHWSEEYARALDHYDTAVRLEQEALPFCLTRINEETANARIAQFRAGMPLRVEEGLVRSGPPRRMG